MWVTGVQTCALPICIVKNFTFNCIKSSVLEELLNEVIESYNNTAHRANFGLSPNCMDEAFVGFNENGVWETSSNMLPEEKEKKCFNVFDAVAENTVYMAHKSIENKEKINKIDCAGSLVESEVSAPDTVPSDVLVKNNNSALSISVLDL